MLVKYKKKAKTQKSRCPICLLGVFSPNTWVKYHIRYDPPIVIMACKYCNYVEWAMRNGHSLPARHEYRSRQIVALHQRMGVKL